ncbi:hypothetical protein O2N63_02500 [Aliiroseovarius sp. KMU-50]|uniref:Peptidase M23 n=1 Tax=Aliiroseovarius salicola TaxID=3009082 RepID=A0ABT4VXF5_9RHOB|nr:hypothetical protein [Aliiroseovarius sp. KMU-50]MDA5092945.1 hypothetical protein [Aliiroseovarius sp. KMU-50]
MKYARSTLILMVLAGPAFAHHDKTPLREAVIDGHSHAVGGATLWLAVAVIAMVLSLYAVHRSIFRKRES